MSNNKQQTALEWYIDELEKYEKGTSEYFSIPAIQNHAIRMEKEGIIDAFDEGNPNGFINKTGEQYYNETYRGNK